MPADGLPIEKTTRLSKINIVDELIKDLQAPDPQKRRKAIWELAQQGDSRAVQPLVDLMIDSDSKQRSLILEALSQIGAKTFKPLNRALAVSLQDDNAEVRKNAIRDLTRIYELVAQVTQMLCHAADDPDPEVQETARWAMSQLSRIRTPMALENLPPSQSSRNLLENHDQEPPR
jgi:HEAT repeat protein